MERLPWRPTGPPSFCGASNWWLAYHGKVPLPFGRNASLFLLVTMDVPQVANATFRVARRRLATCLLIELACLALWLSGSAGRALAADGLSYRRDVAPILSDKCFMCHGPDEGSREADLRLDRRSEAEHVLSPAEPEASELLRRVLADDVDEVMPPVDSRLRLSPEEKQTLRRWILSGAEYESHWAFVPITRPEVPNSTAGPDGWPRGPVDRFIAAALRDVNLLPAPEADRSRLIRRLTFDLTGLPPTLAEIDAYLADDTPGAYERVVDRLLASEQFGVRMASDWLDLSRYSDTYGYQVDRDRYVWPWRDWVVRAINANLPYDQFITWQLAGDLLPEPSDDQILATAFNRLHPQKVEGGSVPEEFRVEYVADRNHTFATAFLGLTLECARCHDHKFDPLTQKEYYQLFAFFNNIDEAGLYSFFTSSVPTPTLLLTDPADRGQIRLLEEEIAKAEQRGREIARRSKLRANEWLSSRVDGQRSYLPGEIAHLDFEELPNTAATTRPKNVAVPGKIGKAAQLTGDDGIKLEVGNFSRNQPFTVALWVNTPDLKERAVIYHRSRAWTDAASRGYQLLLEEGRLSASLIHFWPGNAIRVRMRDPLPVQSWHHVAVTYDGSSRADGLQIYLDGMPTKCDTIRDHLTKNITGGGNDEITIGERFRDRGFTGGKVDEFRVFERELTAIEVAQLCDGAALNEAVRAVHAGQMPGKRLTEYYCHVADPDYQGHLEELRSLRQRRSQLVDKIDEIMVMREMRDRRPTYLLNRGAYDAPGEPVEPDTPATLPAFGDQLPRNRLGLAQWLTDPAHPLTARVAVNRIWKICFGAGLVRTPEDFGSQGQLPSHPKLLDWLADDFVASGWDVKRLMKRLVMSSTYRQDSNAEGKSIRLDPENRLLARGPKFRLPAEMVRDNALAASGLLVRTLGGAPARPYEVGVSFKPVKADEGQGRYRRSLYTYWKRTAPAPVMMTLDAAKRDVCVARRERTTSPLQAFVMLNDPQLIEAAIELGDEALRHCGDVSGDVVMGIFRRLTSRAPKPPEEVILRQLYAEQLAHFETHSHAAEELLSMASLLPESSHSAAARAAAAMVASTVLNLDVCIVRR